MRVSPAFVLLAVGALSLGACQKVKPHVTPDAEPVPDATLDGGNECQEGARQCLANLLQVCSGGIWHDDRVCAGTCDPVEGCREIVPDTLSFIWIANTAEGTVSKVDTRTVTEVARYWTCQAGGYACDPSRTSVNLHGDAVVTNRQASPSSITKFAANVNECIDRNGNDQIDTSTGPNDVKAWGEDECMIWHTPLPTGTLFPDGNHGARATAWDGLEDPITGQGGHVYVGTCTWGMNGDAVFVFDGDTGEVVSHVTIPELDCSYGGAMDGKGSFWIWNSGSSSLLKLEAEWLFWSSVPISCGYGITADAQGRIWTGGGGSVPGFSSCVSRYDPSTGVEDAVGVAGAQFLRGIAVGVKKSAGYVWAADTPGTLYQLDQETMAVVNAWQPSSNDNMIGAAVDFEGYVWTVSNNYSKAWKFDLDNGTFADIVVGLNPYTYSDMTGVQLRNVVPVE
jgi:hypothetical protein